MEDNEGGYMVLKKDMPEFLRKVEIVERQILGVYGFRLLCEATKRKKEDKGKFNETTFVLL